MASKGGVAPTLPCDINRNPLGTIDPWVANAVTSGNVVGGKIDLGYNAFTSNIGAVITKTEVYLDSSTLVSTSTLLPFSGNIEIGGLSSGVHHLLIKAYDSAGKVGSATLNFTIISSVVTPSPTSSPTLTPTATPTTPP
jgi:hypothetical protein